MEVTDFKQIEILLGPLILPLIQKKGAAYIKKGLKIIEN